MIHRESPSDSTWPLVLRLTGIWLVWCAWCSMSGWILSAFGALRPAGYLVCLPLLIGPGIAWWRHSGGSRFECGGLTALQGHWKRRRWLALAFLLIAVLSLVSALVHLPWSFDAVTYRLPRCLYWLAEHRWYWIGTLDGRLDYSACGLEWQMIPLLLLAKTDRILFLLAYLPFLILPGLTYLAGRTLGLARRPLLIWMWLLPCAYCIVLQCSGLQNDGYTASYTAASLAFGGMAIRRKNATACLFAGLAASLLTGAKLSNLPLMLPLGVLFLVAAWQSRFFQRAAVLGLLPMALVSLLPLAVLSIQHTGHWTGDPNDQWGFRTGNPVAATAANLVLAANDLAHPPVMVGTGAINSAVGHLESKVEPLMAWMKQSHRMFSGVAFGDMIYEGGSGPGFSVGLFLAAGLLLGLGIRDKPAPPTAPPWKPWVLGGGIVAWMVLLSQFGSGQSARTSAPYLPLLLFASTALPPMRRFLCSKLATPVALAGMLSAIPVIVLTPARPLIPLDALRSAAKSPAVGKIVRKYELWDGMRDDLKPMRDHLPAGGTVIGYAGAFRDTSYGLWKPIGSRTIREIGVPVGKPSAWIPVPAFVVATRRGIQQRFGSDLETWMAEQRKSIRYSFKRSVNLEGDSKDDSDEWFLLGPS